MASEPVVIAHRGASGERPEHTVAAYERAVQQGAQFIEQDLVPTKDGHLVVRHENELSDTTDIADRAAFATYKRTKVVDGKTVTGWFVEDLTLEQMKTLRCKERLEPLRPLSAKYNGQYEVLTFAEVLRFARILSTRYRRPVGVYPELKHPTYFRSIGLATEEMLLKTLQADGVNLRESRKNRPIFIQCFEWEPLRILRKQTALPLVFLAGRTGVPADGPSRNDNRTYPGNIENWVRALANARKKPDTSLYPYVSDGDPNVVTVPHNREKFVMQGRLNGVRLAVLPAPAKPKPVAKQAKPIVAKR